MAQNIDSDELANIEELLIASSIQVDTAIKMRIERDFFTEKDLSTLLRR